ncbi:MAG: hypothetical protein ACHQNT_00810 [Bacteroidia bacterium]
MFYRKGAKSVSRREHRGAAAAKNAVANEIRVSDTLCEHEI